MSFNEGPSRPYRDPANSLAPKHKPIVYPESIVIWIVLIALAFASICLFVAYVWNRTP